jgi:hypothetical protein
MTAAPTTGLATRVFMMTWLWAIFAGFYLVAYAFWVPHLFSSVAAMVAVIAVTLVLGLGLLYDGFEAALGLDEGQPVTPLPGRRPRRLLGGLVLLAYVLVYVPPTGRIVAHWPLDLAITVVSGVVMIVYGIINK